MDDFELFTRSIRKAKPEDSPELGVLHVDSWRAGYRNLVPDSFLKNMDYESRIERFRTALVGGSEETYVIEQEGVIIGFTTIGECRDRDVNPQATGEIWGIYLAPACFRSGAGSQLCRFAENTLFIRGYTQIKLWVFAGNTNARGFYEAMGYLPDGASKILDRGAPLQVIRYSRQTPDHPENP